MRVNDMVKMFHQDPNYAKRLFGVKPEEKQTDAQPVSMPDWTVIPSKNAAPRMSDEEYEAAYRELARKDLEAGAGTYKDQLNQLRREYISVASPDRKSWFANGASTVVGVKGDKLMPRMHHSPSGMWFYEQTAAEKAREDKLQNIYFEEAEKYEAVHGKPTGAGRVDKLI
jgi:hypothetical protein